MDESRRWKCPKCNWYGKSKETNILYANNITGNKSRLCPKCHTKVTHVVGKTKPVETKSL